MKTTTTVTTAATHLAVFSQKDVIIGKPLSKAHKPYVFCDENKEAPFSVLAYNEEGAEVVCLLDKMFYVKLVRNHLPAPAWTIGEEASDLTVVQAKLLTIALEKQLLIEKLVYAKYIRELSSTLAGFFTHDFNNARNGEITHLLLLEEGMPVLRTLRRNPLELPMDFYPKFLGVKRIEATGSFSLIDKPASPQLGELLSYAADCIYDQESRMTYAPLDKLSAGSPESKEAERQYLKQCAVIASNLVSDEKETSQDQTTQEIENMKKQDNEADTVKPAVIEEEPFLAFIVEHGTISFFVRVGLLSNRLGRYVVPIPTIGSYGKVDTFLITSKSQIVPITQNPAAANGNGRFVRSDTNRVTLGSLDAEKFFFRDLGIRTLEEFIETAIHELMRLDTPAVSKTLTESSFKPFETRIADLMKTEYPSNLYGDKNNYKPFPNVGNAPREESPQIKTIQEDTVMLNKQTLHKNKRVLSFAVIVENPDGVKVIAFENKVTGIWVAPWRGIDGKPVMQEIAVFGRTILYRLNLNSNIETGNYFFDLANSTNTAIPDEVYYAIQAFFNSIPVNKIPKFLEALKTSSVKKTKSKPMAGLNPRHASMPPMGFPNGPTAPTFVEEPFLAFIVSHDGSEMNAQVGVVDKRFGRYVVGIFEHTSVFPITDKIEIIPILVDDKAPIGTGRLVRGDTKTVTPASVVVEDTFFRVLGGYTLDYFIQIATYALMKNRSQKPKIEEAPKGGVSSFFGNQKVIAKDISAGAALTEEAIAIRKLVEWLDLDCYSKDGSIKPEAFVSAVKARFLALETKK